MKTVSISGSPRENVGSKDAKALRVKGQVPCVLYGGKEQVTFYAEELELGKIIFTPNTYIIKLEVAGKSFESVIKEVQCHPVTDKVTHIDFLQLFADKPVKVEVPVNTIGTAPGVREGGKLMRKMRKLNVKALPKDLPDGVELNIEKLNIGDGIRVADISIPGVVIIENPRNEVVGVHIARAVAEEVTPAAAAAAAASAATPGAPAAGAPAAAAGAAPAAGAKAAPAKK